MSSRAELLARYLSGSDSKKRKKKSRKPTSAASTSIIIDVPIIDQPVEDELPEVIPDDETVPVKVELASTKINKGFKRIDNGAIVTKEPEKLTNQQLTNQSQTVYRDSSGKIIDINERKQEFEAKKAQDGQSKFTEIRLNEEEQLKQAKEKYKPPVDEFDDPMSLFESNRKSTDDYTYTKGINPVNRYHIKAGFFWDGIDRSNGFEQLKIRQLNEVKYKLIESSINASYEVDLDDE